MRLVRTVTTAELQVGDVLDWPGGPLTVISCTDTGTVAMFGVGTDYLLDLQKPDGGLKELRSAASDEWTRL